MLSNTLRLNFCYLRIIHIVHDVTSKKIRIYSKKNKQNNKCVCIYEITCFNHNENVDENEK